MWKITLQNPRHRWGLIQIGKEQEKNCRNQDAYRLQNTGLHKCEFNSLVVPATHTSDWMGKNSTAMWSCRGIGRSRNIFLFFISLPDLLQFQWSCGDGIFWEPHQNFPKTKKKKEKVNPGCHSRATRAPRTHCRCTVGVGTMIRRYRPPRG